MGNPGFFYITLKNPIVAPPFGDDTVFFRMINNEMLHFYRGSPLTLYTLPEDGATEPVIARIIFLFNFN